MEKKDLVKYFESFIDSVDLASVRVERVDGVGFGVIALTKPSESSVVDQSKPVISSDVDGI